ncbi:MAG: hypothetical protein ABR600_04050 [Actinomycetota bacterium]
MVRCPVCESQAVSVVLNSKPHASCSTCGARWIQEGSWQRAVRPGQARLDILTANGDLAPANGHTDAPAEEVIVLPDPVARSRRPRVREPEPPAEEAIAT